MRTYVRTCVCIIICILTYVRTYCTHKKKVIEGYLCTCNDIVHAIEVPV